MARWRPPGEKSSPYMTAPGAKALRDELKWLWRVHRPEVTAAVTAAAAEGDRSENAEYIYRKKQLREIDRRIRYLTRRLDVIQVVDRPPSRTDRVFFGATVRVAEPGGGEVSYRIVGADETDPEKNWISVDSPVARALLGKALDAAVRVETPTGLRELEILEIEYPDTGRL